MSQINNPPNALLQPPFFLIPGINPSSPVSAQTEQIDQLNTLLLQEIDANFARFHQIVTTRILPEIKRFAIAGEPTREAAKFWRSFFEAAAAVRVPIPGDISNVPTSPSQPENTIYDDHTLTLRPDDSYLSHARQEGSFMFQNPASSTPRAGGGGGIDESWEDSIESPFDRMDRKLRDELRIGEGGYASSDAPTPSLPSGYDMPRPGDSTYGDVSTGTVEPIDAGRAPLSVQGSRIESSIGQGTPRATRQKNPFREATGSNVNSSGISASSSRHGITDLRSTPLNAKFSKPAPKFNMNQAGPSKTLIVADKNDSDDEINLAMSPPVTMTFNLPPRAQAVLKAGRTPIKSGTTPGTGAGEARMILDDLMEEMERGYEPSPRMPTPEGLGQYSILPGEIQNSRGMLFNAEGGREEDHHPARKSMANTSFGSDGVIETNNKNGNGGGIYQDDDDSFDVEDSFDSPAPAGPSHYANTNTATMAQMDDSYMSMDPNASEAGMIFGGPIQPKGLGKGGFNLMKPDEMMTFHGGRLEDAAGREVMDSPTHAVVKGPGK